MLPYKNVGGVVCAQIIGGSHPLPAYESLVTYGNLLGVGAVGGVGGVLGGVGFGFTWNEGGWGWGESEGDEGESEGGCSRSHSCSCSCAGSCAGWLARVFEGEAGLEGEGLAGLEGGGLAGVLEGEGLVAPSSCPFVLSCPAPCLPSPACLPASLPHSQDTLRNWSTYHPLVRAPH